MNFSTYQEISKEKNHKNSDEYYYVGLANQVGKVLGQRKNFIHGDCSEESFREMLSENIGDVCWYLSMICSNNGLSWNEIMEDNLAKLDFRMRCGVK